MIVVALLFVMVSGVSAQESSEWYLAWNTDGVLMSLTPEGEVNTLIETGVSGENFRSWRMDDGSVLAVISFGEGKGGGLFHLTQTVAQPISLPSNENLLALGDNWQLMARQGIYAVMVNADKFPSGAAIVANLDTNTATILDQQLSFFVPNSTVISGDGHYFRYVGRATPDSRTWTIREYKLDTGTERVIYTIEDDFAPTVAADQYGDHWLYVGRQGATFISHSGEAETIAETGENRQLRQLLGDHLATSPIACEANCTLEWKSLVDDTTQRFDLPPVDTVARILAPVHDSQLLMMADDELWLLDSNDTYTALGRWSPQILITQPAQLLSPDGRWLLTLKDSEDTTGYQVWDLEGRKPLLENDPDRQFYILQVTYGAAGFVVAEDLKHFQYYRYSDGKIFDLEEQGGVFSKVLADGSLLYVQFGESEAHAKGTYHYDPDAQTFTLLIADAIMLNTIEPA
jgi:hypothetical protein